MPAHSGHRARDGLAVACGAGARAALSLAAAGPVLLAVPAGANCATDVWKEAYSPERCWYEGDSIVVSCNDKWNSATCGSRLNAPDKWLGVGQWSTRLKAAPGAGVVTTFYLSNNGGMYNLNGNWNEIDFEIFGNTATPQGTKVWTNLFTGHAVEHSQIIEVPFDVTADFHLYTFDLSEREVKWMVDGVIYRTQDISSFPDAQDSVKNWHFHPFLSVWGKTSKDPPLGVQEFINNMGKLDSNWSPFPLHAMFKMEWNPAVPRVQGQQEKPEQQQPQKQAKPENQAKPEEQTKPQKPAKPEEQTTPEKHEPCGAAEVEVDYYAPAKWFRHIDHVADAGHCCTECQQEPKCKVWTWVKDAKLPDGNPGQCWLKGVLPQRKEPKKGVVSGYPHPDDGSDDEAGEPLGRFQRFPDATAGAGEPRPLPAAAVLGSVAAMLAAAVAAAALAASTRRVARQAAACRWCYGELPKTETGAAFARAPSPQ